VLVHVYWGLDLAEVYRVLVPELRTLREFRTGIVRTL
jgi:uncharacterized protein YutE (UPF0331/DUF86 family)